LVTLEEAAELSRDLARQVSDSGFDPDVVVGIANGGAHPAFIVAQTLGLPCQLFRVQRRSTGVKQAVAFARRPLRSQLLRKLARLVSRYLDKRMSATRAIGRSALEDIERKRVLLVDDCIDTGASIALVRSLLEEHRAAEVKTAVLSWMTKHDSVRMNGVKPDYYLIRALPAYPWSLENPEFAQFKKWLGKHG
jgi:hypoxanthine phosphoribosyltransferase